VWTSFAHVARFGILIARTDADAPKHQGITYFICPMDAPGVTVRPIVEMTGAHNFNEVFLDEVRLPIANRVGDENAGWALAKVTLANERVSLSGEGALWGRGPTAGDLIEIVRSAGGCRDAVLRQRLAQLFIESETLRVLRLRTVAAAVAGRTPGPEASVRKALSDAHGQHVMELAKDLTGVAGTLSAAGPCGSTDPVWSYGYLFAPALTIGGGTSEVQRNIIAERVLGLPHELDAAAGRS
jgi:alkylation response protein AidB-like acyl-CoA dehydrogenase